MIRRPPRSPLFPSPRLSRPRPAAAASSATKDWTAKAWGMFDTERNQPMRVWAVASGFSMRRSEEHTSELQSRLHLVCRLLLEKKKQNHLHLLLPATISSDQT